MFVKCQRVGLVIVRVTYSGVYACEVSEDRTGYTSATYCGVYVCEVSEDCTVYIWRQ